MRTKLSIIVLLLICQFTSGQENILIIDNWKFRISNSNENWLPAKVPGTVHTDLFANGKIPDPFLGCNHKNLSWIEESDWEYTSSFDIPKNINLKKPIELVFDGIDSYAEVFLNGISILKTDNMFREWTVDCSKYLKKMDNQLRVVITSALSVVKEQKARLPFIIPGEEHAYTRKSPYHFGWDWGPRIVTCGIWKPVFLKQNPDNYIQSLWFKTISIDNNKAEIEVTAEVLMGTDNSFTFEITEGKSQKSLLKEKVKANKGLSIVRITFFINNPKLWWPNGMGDQHLYKFIVRISNGWGNKIEKKSKVGIRTIQLVNESDSIGTSFYFQVNNRPFFAKGANFVPPHSFLPSVTDSVWTSLAEQARLSNLNMLRIWGGGAYPPDVFMDACSEKGILIWEDFMFACSMSRWDDDYLETLKQEAIQQVKRLRQFTCLAMWCGNNEVDEAWNNWGWDKMYSNLPGVSDSIWNGYQKIFHKLLPGIVQSFDSGRFYWPSSPQYGWGRKESMLHGDSHYWGVWWGKESFETFNVKIPRFMSEYGYQGSPVSETVKLFSVDGQSTPDFIEMKCHQKHPSGYETIEVYMKREGFYPKSLEQWVYLSQITQSIGYRIAIEAQRMAMPRCMGSLYWQLNDCWPVVSWSGIDYLGRWKAVQFAIRDLYKPVILSSEIDRNHIFVKVVNESGQAIEGGLKVGLFKTDGNIIKEWCNKVSINVNSPKVVFNESIDIPQADTSKYFLYASLSNSTGLKLDTYCFVARTGNLQLMDPDIKISKEGNVVKLSCSKPAFYVQITGKSEYIKVDNNYFHMLPGKEYIVNIEKTNEELVVKSLYNYLHKQ